MTKTLLLYQSLMATVPSAVLPTQPPNGVVSLPFLQWAAVGRKGVLLNGDWKDMSHQRLFLLCTSHSSSSFCFGPFRARITGTIQVPPQVLPHPVHNPKLFYLNELFLPSSLPQDVSTFLGLCPTLISTNSFLLGPSLLDLLPSPTLARLYRLFSSSPSPSPFTSSIPVSGFPDSRAVG